MLGFQRGLWLVLVSYYCVLFRCLFAVGVVFYFFKPLAQWRDGWRESVVLLFVVFACSFTIN